ncbi:MAG TPA: DUF2764 family protein [Rhabdochlamydiaceae bacterium]|nr:DUF2764 family protein [Rhabdochlamydiaceae bacterium]
MAKYYFLTISLPPLSIMEKPEITFEELSFRLEVNLTKPDLHKTQVLRGFVDICNIRALWQEERVDLRGNLNEKELDEALLINNIFPDYVFDFINQFEKISDRIRNFSGLLASFFKEEILQQKGFLRNYLSFERDWRLVLVGLRAKQLGRDVVKELQFEDFSDPLVAHILAQKDSDRYEPPAEYAELKEILDSCAYDPWEEHKAVVRWRFLKIADMAEGKFFSIDKVLAYMAQLMLVEYWHELDEGKGRMILDTFKTG